MDTLTDWLLAGPAWVQYRTRLDVLGQTPRAAIVRAARQAVLDDPGVQGLLAELAQWPGPILKSHKDAGHLLHKLVFIADLGLQARDVGLQTIVERILEHHAPKGPFQVLVNIHPRYGGTGRDQWAWMLCDAPLVVYALLKFGLGKDARVQAAIHYLVSLVRENGWPCAVTPELKFRGPGAKADPCPYATLAMLKMLAQVPGLRDSQASRTGAETLLDLWERRRERRPYLFAMGADFGKLKAPLVWYDILHVLDVLTQFTWLKQDTRLQDMAARVQAKADAQGRFTPESVWMAWKGWEFGQKREPSRWLTLLAQRAGQRSPAWQ